VTATDGQLLARVAGMFDHADPAPAGVTDAALAALASRPLKALTVKQPWASVIATGAKSVENRTWPTKYRGRLAIHAGQSDDRGALAVDILWNAVEADLGKPTIRGAILAVAELTDCHRCDGSCSPWAEPGAWHWGLTNIRGLPEPVPCKGRLSLWTPDAEIRRAVLDQLAGVPA
jgi:hypothetical protein